MYLQSFGVNMASHVCEMCSLFAKLKSNYINVILATRAHTSYKGHASIATKTARTEDKQSVFQCCVTKSLVPLNIIHRYVLISFAILLFCCSTYFRSRIPKHLYNTMHLAPLFKCYIARSSLPVKFRKESSTYFSSPRQKRNFYPPPDSGSKLLKRIAILTSLRLTSPRSSFHYTLMRLEGTKQSVIHI